MNRANSRLPIALGAVVLLAVLGYFGWSSMKAPEGVETAKMPAPVAEQAQVAEAAAEPAPALPETQEAATEVIEHPVDAVDTEVAANATPLPALPDADQQVTEQLTGLLGRVNVLTFLQTDGFVRRVVATVDNLARAQASTRLWPVNPTPGRFSVQKNSDGSESLPADNSQRYAPLVNMIESVDSASAVVVYRRFYPLFQQAYEELGFPGKYFNDRLVEVLDHLIATPVPAGPLAMTLVDVKGSVPSLRPWVRYEFADPDLQAQSAGRKILLRIGPDNQRRLQAKLKDIRQRVARKP